MQSGQPHRGTGNRGGGRGRGQGRGGGRGAGRGRGGGGSHQQQRGGSQQGHNKRPRFNDQDEGGVANGQVWFKESFLEDPWSHLE
ncbi:hypothetical protein JCM3766R1_005134 [Sporobolomyces carnicolor]